MFKKYWRDYELPKNAQFDIYAITSNFFNKSRWNLKKNDNFVTDPTTKKKKKKKEKKEMKIKAT